MEVKRCRSSPLLGRSRRNESSFGKLRGITWRFLMIDHVARPLFSILLFAYEHAKMLTVAIICCVLSTLWGIATAMCGWIETCINCQRYKMHLHYLTLAQKHIDRSEELTRIIDEGYKLVYNQIVRMKKERSCKICFDQPSDIVSYPCMHCSTCQSCSDCLQTCAVCTTPIKDQIKINLC